jgi:hypothetical protein
MTYVLRFLPVVEEDILAGYTWYEEKAPGLGEEFLRVILALCERHCRTETSQRVPDRYQGSG